MRKLFLHHKAKRFTNTSFSCLIFMLMVFCGCVNQHYSNRVSFHPLPDLTFVQTEKDYYGNSYSVYNDFVIIANPPEEHEKLQNLIEVYNEKTLPKRKLFQQFGYIRRFYKESATTPRNYKESHDGYFKIDRWENHGDDLLIIVKWREYGKELTYEFP